ncbi:hypothetical protein CsatB_001405 [Cannabis sativa]|uniref:uncharacterized protein LOC115696213 n=1 Tax=Cannabis sativa TaxID=3483 RepID=UPI0011DF4DE9|nr:uncharacterized protein LOC115696213 [Cannabis sativa]
MECEGISRSFRNYVDNKSTDTIVKTKRTEILEKKKAIDDVIKAASAHKDPLSAFPAFRFYSRHGMSMYLESGRGDKLSAPVKKYIQNLLKVNMERHYGSQWPLEEKVKRREMAAPEARYIFVYEVPNGSPCETSKTSDGKRTITNCLVDRGTMVGFAHFRFVREEGIPVLYVYELQLEARVRGMGLGKFLMQLLENIAQKSDMGAVMLTVQKSNFGAINFYTSVLRYMLSMTSPSRIEPLVGIEKSYIILCKTFNQEAAKAILAEENA